ncbi:MAG: lipopolysaccharide biosynthesis protein, partial [Pseudomonadota bacterium]
DQPDTVDLTALQWLNRKEPRASEKNRHHHRSVKKSETSKRFVTTKNRILAPEHFGIVALATMIILIAQMLLYQGVGEALAQREGIETDHFSSTLWMNIGLASTVALTLIWASEWIAAALSEPEFGPILRAVAPMLLVYAASAVLQAKLRRDLKLKGFALASIFATFCGAAVAASMALMGFEVWSLVGQQWTYASVSTITFLISARWALRLFVSLAHVVELAAFSINTAGAALLRFSLRQADILVLGFFVSAKEIGYYFLASRMLAMAAQLTYHSMEKIALPLLSRLQNDPEELRSAVLMTFRFTCLTCLPIFFGMAAMADMAIPVVFGEEWAGSVQPFQVFCIFSIAYALSLAAKQVLLSLGQASVVFRLSLANAVLFLAAVALAAPYGITAAALAGGVANSLMIPAYCWAAGHRVGLNLSQIGNDQSAIWASMVGMVAAIAIYRHYALADIHSVIAMILSSLFGAIVFCAMMIMLRRDTVEQLWVTFFGQSQAMEGASTR